MGAMDEHEEKSPATWLDRALAAPFGSHVVDVAGCPIHYLQWGDRARPGLMFVAGAGGHAHWFSHVARLFADQFNVVAIDPGGCGDSGRRPAYALDLVIAEIMAVCADAGMLAGNVPPILVGHSAGGQFVVRTAIAEGAALLGVIAVDAIRYARLAGDPALRPRPETPQAAPPPRLYPDEASAIARFRLQPAPLVAVESPALLAHIARHSVREVEGGWTWKFDSGLTATLSAGLDLVDALADLPCRFAALYGEKTHLADETMLEKMTLATRGEAPVFVIPGSGHYPMLDNPLAFVTAIKGIATGWLAAERRDRRLRHG